MIGVSFDPGQLTDSEQLEWWAQWDARAQAATEELLVAFEEWLSLPSPRPRFKYKFKEQIWRDLKKWLLLNIFNGKCAYCETKTSRFPYPADHFRPKGGVRQPAADGKLAPIQACAPDGGEIDHPGYVWLAYHWRNLLPSCHFCNSAPGKQDQFPLLSDRSHVLLKMQTDLENSRGRQSRLWPKYWYLEPLELDSLEGPALLHPYNGEDDPRNHICFEEHGVEYWKSEKGRWSIQVYNLKDAGLREERGLAQEQARTQYYLALASAQGDSEAVKDAAGAFIASFDSGKVPYSAAVQDYLLWLREQEF